MRGRRGLISSSFLVFLLPLILVSCSGGGGDTPPPAQQASAPVVAAPVTLFYRVGGGSVVQVDTTPRVLTTAGVSTDWDFVHVVGERVIMSTVGFINMESLDFDGQNRRMFADDRAHFQGGVQGRVVYRVDPAGDDRDDEGDFYSVLPDATDLRRLTMLPHIPFSDLRDRGMVGSVGNLMLFGVPSSNFPITKDLAAVPVTGGPVVVLAEGPDYQWLGAVVGNRVVYHQCPVDSAGRAGQCDLYSVFSDGTGRTTLSTHPSNERVQGVIHGRILVRRNSGGATDELYTLAPDGIGSEQHVAMVNNATDFVVGTAADLIILQRGSRLWTMQADGSNLQRLTDSQVSEEFAAVVGDWIITYREPNAQHDIWAVPAVGDGPPVAIAQTNADELFVAGL